MEVGGYSPVEVMPSPTRAAEVAAAAAVIRSNTENIVGAEKVQMRNEQMENAAKKRLEGLETNPGVGIAARAAIEAIAMATDFGAGGESLWASVDSKLAGGAEVVARVVGDMKLGEWGRKVNIATQLASAREQAMDKMRLSKEARSVDARSLLPEWGKGMLDKLAGHFRKTQGEHERRADEMMSRADSLRALKTEKVPMSAELSVEVVQNLEATQVAQAAKIAELENYINGLKMEASERAQVVGGTKLQETVAKGPFN